jgi:hypothetical protein
MPGLIGEEINDAYCDGILQYLESRYIPGLRQHLAVRHNINPCISGIP